MIIKAKEWLALSQEIQLLVLIGLTSKQRKAWLLMSCLFQIEERNDIMRNNTINLKPNAPIAVYLRKSRMEEGQDIEETLAKHRKEIESYIEANGFRNVEWYEEIESGEKIEFRPKMKLLLDEVSAGQYKAVIAIHIDRLSRGDMLDRGLMTNAFKESNTLLITTTNNKVYDFANGEDILTEIEMMFANMEYKTIRRRLLAGKDNAFKDGKIVGSKPPYGYYKDYNTNSYFVDEDKAKVYLWIVDRYLSGISTHKIAQELNRSCILSPSGRKNASWSHNYLNDMLKNPFYAGYVVRNRSTTTRIGKTKHSRKRHSPNDYEKVKGTHAALIDEETYNKILHTLRINIKRPHVTRANKFRLTGLVKCKACGYGVTVRRKKKVDGSEYALLRKCKYPLSDGTTCEANRGIKESTLVDFLYNDMRQYKERLFNPLETSKESILEVNHIVVQNTLIDDARGKLERAKLLFIDGDIDKGDYDTIKKKQTKLIDEAQQEIERLSISPEIIQEEQRKKWRNVDIDKIFLNQMSSEEFNCEIIKLVKSISYLYDDKESLQVDIEYL